jgi:hypothetical protein
VSRPMEFPSRSGRLFPILFAVLFGPFFLAAGAGGWLALTLSPLQNFYLGTYAASSVGQGIPNSETTIRWAMKTAPKRKSVPMMPGDAIRDTGAGTDKKLPLKLSGQAIAEGWRGVALSAPERGPASILAPILRDTFFDGEEFYKLMAAPMLGALAVAMLLFAGFLRRREAWSSASDSWVDRRRERRHGRPVRGPEWGPELKLPGWTIGRAIERFRARRDAGIRLRLTGDSLLSKLPWFGPTYRIPRRLESSHILLMGDTGSGKSSAIRQILRQVEGRGETALVYDPAMDFVGEFYSPKRGDLILNPLDARCPYWSLGDETRGDERGGSAAAIAAAFLPDKEYEKAFFTDSPRRILAHLLRKKPRPRDILDWMADPERIEEMVRGTPLAALIDPAAPAQRTGVISSLNMVADSLELLPEWDAQRRTFSTAEWRTERKRWVFLTSSPGHREKILPLHSVWLDLFILRMMGPCEDSSAKPVWFVIDELASLNKLPQLHTAVTENRKYGNPVVLGFQGRSQMEKRYGQDAEAMLSQPATKIFLKTSEPRAAKWISDAIGEIEVERLKESRGIGLFKDKKSFALEIATKPLVMASEIAGLEPLRGFIKQENRVVPARFRLAKKRAKQPEFLARKMPELRPRPQIAAIASTPAPPLVAAAQSVLPLAPATAKPAFVWDESQGIE